MLCVHELGVVDKTQRSKLLELVSRISAYSCCACGVRDEQIAARILKFELQV